MNARIFGLVAALLVCASAQAQLVSVDNGAAAVDSNGLMWANTVGIELGWSASPIYPNTAQSWIASLNASDYDGHNDWMLPTAYSGLANTTTNQLGELFYTDCGNSPGSASVLTNPGKNCTALSAVSNAINTGTNGLPGDMDFSSGTSLGLVDNLGYWSWTIYRAFDGTEGYWDGDTSNNGVVGRADTLAVREVTRAPEIDPASTGTGLTLLLGGMMIVTSRRRDAKKTLQR